MELADTSHVLRGKIYAPRPRRGAELKDDGVWYSLATRLTSGPCIAMSSHTFCAQLLKKNNIGNNSNNPSQFLVALDAVIRVASFGLSSFPLFQIGDNLTDKTQPLKLEKAALTAARKAAPQGVRSDNLHAKLRKAMDCWLSRSFLHSSSNLSFDGRVASSCDMRPAEISTPQADL